MVQKLMMLATLFNSAQTFLILVLEGVEICGTIFFQIGLLFLSPLCMTIYPIYMTVYKYTYKTSERPLLHVNVEMSTFTCEHQNVRFYVGTSVSRV